MASTWAKILSDVKTLTVASQPTANVKIRKRVKRFADEDLPLIIIAPLGDVQVQPEEAFEEYTHINYEVLIAIVYDGNQKIETELANVLDMREDLRQALDVRTLSTATTVYDSAVNLNPVYDLAEMDKNYDYSTFSVVYGSKEQRAGS